jgi:hypothetical protein
MSTENENYSYVRDEWEEIRKTEFSNKDGLSNFVIAYHSDKEGKGYVIERMPDLGMRFVITENNGDNLHSTGVNQTIFATYRDVVEHVKEHTGLTPENDIGFSSRLKQTIVDGFAKIVLDNGKINIHQIPAKDVHLRTVAKLFNKFFGQEFQKRSVDDICDDAILASKHYSSIYTDYENNAAIAFSYLSYTKATGGFVNDTLDTLHTLTSNKPDASNEYVEQWLKNFYEGYMDEKIDIKNDNIGLSPMVVSIR